MTPKFPTTLRVLEIFFFNSSALREPVRPDLMTQGVNTLEKVAHQYHMHELYTRAAPIYQRMKLSPPEDPELCPCVNDVTGNGVLIELLNHAKMHKFFDSSLGPPKLFDILGGGGGGGGGSPASKEAVAEAVPDHAAGLIEQYSQMYMANSSREHADLLASVILNMFKLI